MSSWISCLNIKGREQAGKKNDISWNELSSWSSKETMRIEVQKIIHLQTLAKKNAKSYVSIVNTPIKFDVPVGQCNIAKQIFDMPKVK